MLYQRAKANESLGLVAAHAAFAATQFLITWVAAIATSLDDLTALSLAQAIVWPLAIVTQLQLRNVYLVFHDRRLFRRFLLLRVSGCCLLMAAAFAAARVLHPGGVLWAYALALASIKCVEHIADVMHAELQRASALQAASLSQLGRCSVFIVVYIAACAHWKHLIPALIAGLAAMAAWVLLVDLRMKPVTEAFRATGEMPAVGYRPIVMASVAFSVATALNFFSLVVGRWAAMNAGDLPAVGAAALAATVASIASVILAVCQQFSIRSTAESVRCAGVSGAYQKLSTVIRRLHLVFALLFTGWLVGAIAITFAGLPLPARFSQDVRNIATALAGCYIVGAWLGLLAFKEILVLVAMGLNGRLLAISLLQAAVALLVVMAAYPRLGWPAIGLAEFARALAFVAASRLSTRKISTLAPASRAAA